MNTLTVLCPDGQADTYRNATFDLLLEGGGVLRILHHDRIVAVYSPTGWWRLTFEDPT